MEENPQNRLELDEATEKFLKEYYTNPSETDKSIIRLAIRTGIIIGLNRASVIYKEIQ